MKIAVVGFGWLGFPLGKELLKKGHTVVGSTTSAEKIIKLKADNLEAILLNTEAVFPQNTNDFFDNTDICIINVPPNRRSNAEGLEQEVTIYGERMMRIAKIFPAKTHFIFVGSTGIYPNEIGIAKEDEFDRTMYLTSNSLAFAEEKLHQFLENRLTVLRFAGLVGGERQIGKYIAGRKEIPNGDTPVNLIHQTDCIRIIERIIETNSWGDVFNGCASEHPTRKEYYTVFCQQHKLPMPEFLNEENQFIGKKVDNQKSKNILNFEYLYDNPFKMS
jgi:nucleoside-diphosphate-sugar epimerase